MDHESLKLVISNQGQARGYGRTTYYQTRHKGRIALKLDMAFELSQKYLLKIWDSNFDRCKKFVGCIFWFVKNHGLLMSSLKTE